MANNVYGVGLYSVGSYQVAGRPYCATGSTNSTNVRTSITFPEVSKELVVLNLTIYFYSFTREVATPIALRSKQESSKHFLSSVKKYFSQDQPLTQLILYTLL